MKKTLFPALLVCLSIAFVSCKKDSDEPNNNIVTKNGIAITGAQEVPAVTTTGSGTLNLSYDKNTNVITYTVNFTGLSSNTTMAHFHGPATPTQTAPPTVSFTSFPTATSGTYTGTATITDALEADMLAGKWYINIHTANNPGGEIRGNITF